MILSVSRLFIGFIQGGASVQLVDRLPIHAQNKLTDLKKADYTGLPIMETESIFS